MLNTKTFSDILDEVSSEDTTHLSAHTDWNAGWESVLDATYMSQIMAQSTSYRFQTVRNPAYAYKKSHGPANKTPPAHVMSEEQFKAYQTLLQWAPQLPAWFNLTQLKSAYRRSMLKTHPDHGGHSESFHEAKKSYQILLALVK